MKQQQLTLITELQEINRAAADYMCMDNIVLIFVYKNYTSYLRLKGFFSLCGIRNGIEYFPGY